MLIRDCVLKKLRNDTWLHHTASGYKVRMNDEAVGVLKGMAGRRTAAEMTEKEKYVYDKLSAKGIAAPDTGRAGDHRIPEKSKSLLESVELEFSGRCNLRCAHCFASLSQQDMGQETLDSVFEGLDALDPVNLVLSGGEPLLNPLLPETLKKARARNMRISVMTNATLAGEGTACLFKAYGVAKAIVSLDFFREDHDALRGAGAFDKAVAGINFFVSGKVPVHITALVREGTAGRVEEFKDFCLNGLGASGIRFSAVTPIGSAKDSPGLQLSASKTKELFSKGVLSGGDEADDVFARLAGSRNFYCNAGIGQCFISAAGLVYACHYFQNLGVEMGGLAAMPLERLYTEHAGGGAITADLDWDRLKKCKTCAQFARCLGGCRARARIMTGDWYAADTFSCGMYGIE